MYTWGDSDIILCTINITAMLEEFRVVAVQCCTLHTFPNPL